MSSLVYFASSNTGKQSEFCFAGATNGAEDLIDGRLLYRHGCSFWINKKPLYLDKNKNGTFELVHNGKVQIAYNP
jgi:hypothetical protein